MKCECEPKLQYDPKFGQMSPKTTPVRQRHLSEIPNSAFGQMSLSDRCRPIHKNCEKIFGPSHSRYVPIIYKGSAPVSELVLLRGGLPSKIALQVGKVQTSKILNRLISGKIRSGSKKTLDKPVPSHSVTVVPVTFLIVQSFQLQSFQSHCHSFYTFVHTLIKFIAH